MDFILEMASLDSPDTLRFERASTREEKMHFTTSNVRWANVLSGRALAKFFGRFAVTIPDTWKSPRGLPPKMPPAPQFSGPGVKDFSGQKG